MSLGVEVVGGRGVMVPTAAGRARRDRLFFTGMAAAAALTVFAGFAPTYYLRSAYGVPGLPALLHIHGLIFTSWILLFVVQTSLVAARRVRIHRRLGVAGGIIALAMLVVGFAAAQASARRGFTPPGGPPPLVFLIIPLVDLLVFAALCGTGLYMRRQPETHKRLMLLSTLALLTPAIARLSFVGGGIPVFWVINDVLIIACLVYDRVTRGRVHRAFLWGGLAIIVSQPLRLVLAGTGAWMSLAAWIAR